MNGMAGMTVREADRPGDLGWVVMAHGELYTSEFGWTVAFEEMVAEILGAYAAHHDPDRERVWIAEVDGERVGCIACMHGDDADTAKLRVLLVDPKHRGLGIGAALVDGCVGFAREAGYARMSLWTTGNLHSARRLYEAAGFLLIDEQPHNGFGPALVGQTWEVQLTP
jgi:GNAT superfamily N-acetyltransferase